MGGPPHTFPYMLAPLCSASGGGVWNGRACYTDVSATTRVALGALAVDKQIWTSVVQVLRLDFTLFCHVVSSNPPG